MVVGQGFVGRLAGRENKSEEGRSLWVRLAECFASSKECMNNTSDIYIQEDIRSSFTILLTSTSD